MLPSDAEIRAALVGARTVAIVGLSDRPERDSHEVARYLRSQGYRVIPVNPAVSAVLGEPSYPSVAAIPPEIRVDLVDVFRRSDQVPPIARESVRRGVKVLWMQLGIENSEAAAYVRGAGGMAFEDLCLMTEHRRLGLPAVGPAA